MLCDLFFPKEVGGLIVVNVFINVIVHGGVTGGEVADFNRSRHEFLESVTRISPGDGGGIDEPHELKDEATESIDSAPV